MDKQYNNISNEAVKRATGKTWDEWFGLLGEKDAEEHTHKENCCAAYRQGLH